MAMTKHHDQNQFWEAINYYSLQLRSIMKKVNFKSLTQRNITGCCFWSTKKNMILNISIHRKLNSQSQHRTEK